MERSNWTILLWVVGVFIVMCLLAAIFYLN